MADEQQNGSGAQTDQSPAFGENFFSSYQLVNDSGEPIQEPQLGQQAQPQQQNNPQQGQPQQQQNGQQQGQPAQQPQPAVNPAQPAQQSPLDDLFYSLTNGQRQFNPDAAVSFFENVPPTNARQQQMQQAAQQAQQPAAQQVAPAQAAPEPTYEDNLRRNMLLQGQHIRQYMQAGYTPEQALELSEREIGTFIEKHLVDRRFGEFDQKLTAREKEIQSQRELLELQPMADNNLISVSNEYSKSIPPARMKELMFNPKYGGEFLNRMFDAMNPDKKTLQGNDLSKAMKDWWVRFASSEDNLRMAAMVTHAAVQKELLPQIVKHIKAQTQAQIQGNAEGRARQVSGMAANPPATGNGRGTGFPELDRYLNHSTT